MKNQPVLRGNAQGLSYTSKRHARRRTLCRVVSAFLILPLSSNMLLAQAAPAPANPQAPAPQAPANPAPQTPGNPAPANPQSPAPQTPANPAPQTPAPNAPAPQNVTAPAVPNYVQTPYGVAPGTTPFTLPAPFARATAPDQALSVYGYDFFAQARAYVDSLRAQPAQANSPAQQNNALTLPTAGGNGFQNTNQPNSVLPVQNAAPPPTVNPYQVVVGPDLNRYNIAISVPDRYLLGPGDTLSLYYSAPTTNPTTTTIQIDSKGTATLPFGERVVLRGMTLVQAEKTITKLVGQQLKDLNMTVTLKELRTQQVWITGSSYAPGAYQVPAAITLFNLLYLSGGPKLDGSFRNITVQRANGEVHRFDFYKFFMNSDRKQDINLLPGDVVHIPPTNPRVGIRGEVFQQGLYELSGTERLKDVIAYAKGIRPSAIAQRISVESIRPGIAYRMVDVNLLDTKPENNPPLHDGDMISVHSLRPVIENLITVEGNVDQPGRYALNEKQPTTIRDLILRARGVLSDTFYERADLYRLNPDFSYTLIRVHLGNALQGKSPDNYILKPQDNLRIYSLKDVQFLGFRQVTIVGAVSAPGDVYRTDGMRVYDLLIKAGGLRFDAYHEKISIQRRNLDGTFGPIIFVNADKAAKGDPKENVELQDRDLLQVYSVRDFNFIPEQKVQILGAVQRPGIYPFGKDMRVRDLIQLSGNFLPNTFLERGFIQRRNLDGTVGPLYIIDLNKVLSDDPQHNLALQLNDEVSVYTKEGADYIPNQLVSINGAIQKPGTFPFAPNMKVRDLLQLAGNVTPEASLQRAFVQRRYLDGTVGPLYQIDLNKAYKDDPKHNLALQTHDEVTIFTKKKADYLPPQEVIISGAVQAPGTFPRSEGMKLKDLLLLAGGTLPNADDTIEIAHPRRPVGSPILRISLKKALAEDTTQNIVLEDGDTIAIKTDKNILISPFRVTVLGSVNRSGDFPITERTMRLSTFFKRVNGFLPNSAPKYALLARRPEYLTAEHQTSIVGRARNLSQLIQADAYKRAVSRAEAERAQQLVNLSNYVQRSNATSILNQAGQAPSIIPTELLKTDPATPARPLRDEDLQAPGTIPVNLEYVLKHPGSAEDLVIRDGDIITIPEKPANVTVVGAVTQPSTILFREGASLGYYLAQSGGRNIDADPEQALVIRMNGRVLMANKAKVELGDIIFIPTRVMAAKLPKTQSDFDRWFGVITNGVLSYAILRSIIK